jgi:hypothetical protein
MSSRAFGKRRILLPQPFGQEMAPNGEADIGKVGGTKLTLGMWDAF